MPSAPAVDGGWRTATQPPVMLAPSSQIKEWILGDDPKEGRTLMRGLGAGVITYLVTGSLGLAVLAVVVSSCLG